MRLSRIVLVLVAVVAAGLAAFLALGSGSGQPQQQAPAQVVQEARAQVLVAKADIGLGERLSPDNLQWQDWPEGAVRAEYITSKGTPDAIDKMKGSVARFEIFPGEPIQQAKLVKSDQGYLSAVLDKGMRGVSISVNAESASGGFIVPNDHVDVILTTTAAADRKSPRRCSAMCGCSPSTRASAKPARPAPPTTAAARAAVTRPTPSRRCLVVRPWQRWSSTPTRRRRSSTAPRWASSRWPCARLSISRLP